MITYTGESQYEEGCELGRVTVNGIEFVHERECDLSIGKGFLIQCENVLVVYAENKNDEIWDCDDENDKKFFLKKYGFSIESVCNLADTFKW